MDSKKGEGHPAEASKLRLVRIGIDTYQEPIAYMSIDCPVARSEGFASQSRVLIKSDHTQTVATLNIVTSDLLEADELALSEPAWKRLNVTEGMTATVSHPRSLESLGFVRSKIFGERLDPFSTRSIIEDVVEGRYRDVHIAAFLTACATAGLDVIEISDLTTAMVRVGERLDWEVDCVVDKHCIGGLPGNRTTPLVVSIVTAFGLTMPKTSSRAITSPAGTADTMETLTEVDLTLEDIRRVVKQEGGCIAWGGSVQLSPTDDIFIRIERALDIDAAGQMVASILSKKLAAGATHVVVDIPHGPTAKVRSTQEAYTMAGTMVAVGERLGLRIEPVITDGRQPVGRGIGPALEAHDLLAVLRGEDDAPIDLAERAILLSGRILELSEEVQRGRGEDVAREMLADGRALQKFMAICEAQGGFSEPPVAEHSHDIVADRDGVVTAIDNRRISNAAKLAGAPLAPAAGIWFDAPIGRRVTAGDLLFTVHAESPGELRYALEYLSHHPEIVQISDVEDE
jgi:thymidine phosphorylase